MEIKNKIVLITGGTSGLGLSITKKCLGRDAIVHTISIDQSNHENLKREISNRNFFTHQGDVSDYYGIEKIVREIKDIDVLINNAGIWTEGLVSDNKPEDISRVIDVNTKGVIFVTKAVLPRMLERNNGFILNISSTSGLRGRENQSVYVASKFGVTGFTESLKEDLKGTNVKVAGFYPGGMKTKFFEKAGFPKQNDDWMDTDKVADVILFILEQNDTMVLDHVVLNKRDTK